MRIEVDQYQLIRQLYLVEGVSQREIARRLHVSRRTVRRYCEGDLLPGQRKQTNRTRTVITRQVESFIRQCLLDDEKEPNRKQHHTARRIYHRLRDELEFTGSESSVRAVTRTIREEMGMSKRAFVPLVFEAGEAAQVDWGEATFYLDEQRVRANLFCIRLCNSCMPYVVAFPTAKLESFIEGHARALEFFGGTPRTLIYDNLRTAVQDGWGHHVRHEQKDFQVLKAHYAFESRFCNPGAGNEKGLVENLVGWIRRNLFVPLPRVSSWEDLNRLLEQRCLDYRDHTIQGRSDTVGALWDIEKLQLLPLPRSRMNGLAVTTAIVDSYSLVRFQTNSYSVPTVFVGKTVTVQATPFDVFIYQHNELIASHIRQFGKYQFAFQWEHYLSLLEKRPGAVWNSRPLKKANFPPELWAFLKKLPQEKDVVKALRCVSQYGLKDSLDAISECLSANTCSVNALQAKLDATLGQSRLSGTFSSEIKVQAPDLSVYNHIIGGDVA